MIVRDKISFDTPEGSISSLSVGEAKELPIRASSLVFTVGTTSSAVVEFEMSPNKEDWYQIEGLGELLGDTAVSIGDDTHLFKYIRPVFSGSGTITECSVHFRYAKR